MSAVLGPAAIVVVGLTALLHLLQVVQVLQAEDRLLRAVGVRRACERAGGEGLHALDATCHTRPNTRGRSCLPRLLLEPVAPPVAAAPRVAPACARAGTAVAACKPPHSDAALLCSTAATPGTSTSGTSRDPAEPPQPSLTPSPTVASAEAEVVAGWSDGSGAGGKV